MLERIVEFVDLSSETLNRIFIFSSEEGVLNLVLYLMRNAKVDPSFNEGEGLTAGFTNLL